MSPFNQLDSFFSFIWPRLEQEQSPPRGLEKRRGNRRDSEIETFLKAILSRINTLFQWTSFPWFPAQISLATQCQMSSREQPWAHPTSKLESHLALLHCSTAVTKTILLLHLNGVISLCLSHIMVFRMSLSSDSSNSIQLALLAWPQAVVVSPKHHKKKNCY